MFLKKIWKNPFVIAFFVGILSLHVGKWIAQQRISAPPPLLSIGEWSLTDQAGKQFGSKELAGKVVIASLFFTSCPTICPRLIESMKQLERTFPDNNKQIQFLSISVDPENDTSQVLEKFMTNKEIKKDRWSFLTGEKKLVYELVVEKMKLHIGEKRFLASENGKEEYDIGHLAELMLIDQNGDLRGLFSTEPHGLAALERAAKLLIKEGTSA